MTRYFRNSPQLNDFASVEWYADALAAIVVKGYTGPDGTLRACCENSSDSAGRVRATLPGAGERNK